MSGNSGTGIGEGTLELAEIAAKARGCSVDKVLYDALQLLLECGQARFGLPALVADLPFTANERALIEEEVEHRVALKIVRLMSTPSSDAVLTQPV